MTEKTIYETHVKALVAGHTLFQNAPLGAGAALVPVAITLVGAALFDALWRIGTKLDNIR